MRLKIDKIESSGVNRSRDKDRSLSVAMRANDVKVEQNLKEIFEK